MIYEKVLTLGDRSSEIGVTFLSGTPEKALLNLAMKLRDGGALRAPPSLNFIAKISNTCLKTLLGNENF